MLRFQELTGLLRKLSGEELTAVNVKWLLRYIRFCTSRGRNIHQGVAEPFQKAQKTEYREFAALAFNTSLTVAQDRLLTVTNTYEGVGFIPSSWSLTAQECISHLFPLLPERYAAEDAARLYEQLGTTHEQMGLNVDEGGRLVRLYRQLRWCSNSVVQQYLLALPTPFFEVAINQLTRAISQFFLKGIPEMLHTTVRRELNCMHLRTASSLQLTK